MPVQLEKAPRLIAHRVIVDCRIAWTPDRPIVDSEIANVDGGEIVTVHTESANQMRPPAQPRRLQPSTRRLVMKAGDQSADPRARLHRFGVFGSQMRIDFTDHPRG
jgi:hypothetical protein